MRFIDAATVEVRLSYPRLVDVLADAFRAGADVPPRHHHAVRRPGQPDAMLLLMPAWTPAGRHPGGYIGTKLIAFSPDNGARGLPAVQGAYVLMSLATGETLAVIDAPKLTTWRTAAASALAARAVARPDASRMLMVGGGAMAPYLIRAHASVRPIRHVDVWNRSRAGAEKVVAGLVAEGHAARRGLTLSVTDDLETAVRAADIVSTATISNTPLVHGAWLKPGAHVDCVGAFRRDMRETDDEVVRRSTVYIDTRDGARGEAGDLLQAIDTGAFAWDRVAGDLAAIAKGTIAPRTSADQITFFKSVGASIEDLAAAIEVFEAG